MHTSENIWNEIWNQSCKLLQQSLETTQFNNWIKPLQLDGVDESQGKISIRLKTGSLTVKDLVTRRFLKEIERAVSEVTNESYPVTITTDSTTSDSKTAENEQENLLSPQNSTPPLASPPLVKNPLFNTKNATKLFDHRFTFESFIVGNSNNHAYTAAKAVGEQPGNLYNPLFLYSAPGLGKTHLLKAIANHIAIHHSHLRVACVSAENFTNEYIDSLGKKQMSEFRTKYRQSFDVLLIDDIQFIANKTETEQEFFHTFNDLYQSNRQIVLTSDRPPKDIENISERIRTRFASGLTIDIQIPEIETRIAILKSRAELDDIYLPDDVAVFIATHVKSSVRELEGILVNLKSTSSLMGSEISMEMAKQQLKLSLPEESNAYTVESILHEVARFSNIKISDLKSNTKVKSIALPRQIAAYLIRKYTPLSLKEIGLYLGGRDHTTILHAVQQITKGLDLDPQLKITVEKIQDLL